MGNVNFIDPNKAAEELLKYFNKKGFMEVAIRDSKKKFKSFQKISFSQLSEGQTQKNAEKMFNAINKNNKINMKNTKLLGNIKNLNQINMLLNGLNLCATVAGFAILYMKLNKMSKQINEVLSTVKKGQDIQAQYEFNKILSTHSDMLDHRKTQRYYTEDQMRELVDGEYNVLSMLVEVFNKGVSEDTETLIYSIISLASMLAVSIRYFDEAYYYNTKDTINNKDIWHGSHDNWVKIYDDLTSNEFIETLQDYAMFNLGLNIIECDTFCISVVGSFKSAKKDIEDNQYLLTEFDNPSSFQKYKDFTNQELKAFIESNLKECQLDNDEIFDNAMKQVGIV